MNDTGQVIGCNPGTFNVLANDSDPDGDPIHLVSVTSGMYGSAHISGSSVVYTRSGSTTGLDTLFYVIGDNHGATDGANVFVTVSGHVECLLANPAGEAGEETGADQAEIPDDSP